MRQVFNSTSISPVLMDHLEASGSWYDIGVAQGRDQRPMVKYTIYCYASYHAGSSQRRALPAVIRKIERFLGRAFPNQLAEIAGIADGAGVDPGLLLASQFPEAMYATLGVEYDPPYPGPSRAASACSTIMFPTSEWGPLLGGTLDDDPRRFLLTARPDHGLASCCILWPGWTFTWGGMNGAGLAICSASARPWHEENRFVDTRIGGFDMVPPVRVLLTECQTVEQALARLREPTLGPVGNMGIIDASGRGVLIQGCQQRVGQLHVTELDRNAAAEGLCSGNFHLWDVDPDEFKDTPGCCDAVARYRALKAQLAHARGNYSIEAMKAILTSHDGEPEKKESICNDTQAAMVAAPREGRLLFASKPPCVTGFIEYPIR